MVSIGQIVLIAVLLNAASIGDLTVASGARRWPAETLFAADQQGIQVFTRQS
jgi:hypothetical protein